MTAEAVGMGQERRIDRWFTGGLVVIEVVYAIAWWAANVEHSLGIAII
ncbi:hypothetical protein OIK40_04715 [Erythrobacter sp. sf7]|uniref:Uncharacterized protein n=1 Tax=Erythrobacter fulvus TaxID=2987523 RepID=A0ABT5JP99_9SPHN|nr:hypothetical protein [Erythrobacter fulvus]MDC8753943.1 hypothetical protein [Erythrobacter fulvus]